MTAHAHPTTEVFAFSPPKIKGDAVAFDAVIGAGKRMELHSTATVWRALASHLLTAFPELCTAAKPVPAAALKPNQAKNGRSKVTSAAIESYLLLYRDHRAGLFPSFAAGCTERGVNYHSAKTWLRTHAADVPALLSTLPAAPILKPSGKIL